jgi:mono/diheme cytochrome c family protein
MRRAALVLLLAALVAALALAGCGGEEVVAPTAETVIGTLPEQPAGTTGGETTGGETTGGDTTGGDQSAGADADAGKMVFTSAGCTGCHTLADAGATGNVGPNLDDAKPPAELVVDRVTNGKGAMPSFKGQLSEQDIENVAAYVSSVAGQ